jgi:hypothetical protein
MWDRDFQKTHQMMTLNCTNIYDQILFVFCLGYHFT